MDRDRDSNSRRLFGHVVAGSHDLEVTEIFCAHLAFILSVMILRSLQVARYAIQCYNVWTSNKLQVVLQKCKPAQRAPWLDMRAWSRLTPCGPRYMPNSFRVINHNWWDWLLKKKQGRISGDHFPSSPRSHFCSIRNGPLERMPGNLLSIVNAIKARNVRFKLFVIGQRERTVFALKQGSNQNANISLKQEREFDYSKKAVGFKLFFEYALKANIRIRNKS